MKYFSENHDVVINASGGYAVLERLGFKTEEGEMAKKKKAAAVKRPALLVKDGLVEKKIGAKKTQSIIKPAPHMENATHGFTRNQMMLAVKDRGIKNFRVMNKEELSAILEGATPAQIEAIQLAAVTRWKAGWSKKSTDNQTAVL